MAEDLNDIVFTAVRSQEDAVALVEKLFDVAQPSAVYGEPVTVGDHTVITASEVRVGMGFGFGSGGASGGEDTGDEEDEDLEYSSGFGSGGGGGGVSGGRPVAAITIGPNGVCVQPVVDVTKIALAAFTALGAMFIMLGRMRATSRQLGGS